MSKDIFLTNNLTNKKEKFITIGQKGCLKACLTVKGAGWGAKYVCYRKPINLLNLNTMHWATRDYHDT